MTVPKTHLPLEIEIGSNSAQNQGDDDRRMKVGRNFDLTFFFWYIVETVGAAAVPPHFLLPPFLFPPPLAPVECIYKLPPSSNGCLDIDVTQRNNTIKGNNTNIRRRVCVKGVGMRECLLLKHNTDDAYDFRDFRDCEHQREGSGVKNHLSSLFLRMWCRYSVSLLIVLCHCLFLLSLFCPLFHQVRDSFSNNNKQQKKKEPKEERNKRR